MTDEKNAPGNKKQEISIDPQSWQKLWFVEPETLLKVGAANGLKTNLPMQIKGQFNQTIVGTWVQSAKNKESMTKIDNVITASQQFDQQQQQMAYIMQMQQQMQNPDAKKGDQQNPMMGGMMNPMMGGMMNPMMGGQMGGMNPMMGGMNPMMGGMNPMMGGMMNPMMGGMNPQFGQPTSGSSFV